ncbi:putative ensconsin-like [Cocos nucifera]|nr:putative ensconsin-like [Cocos nucifera]
MDRIIDADIEQHIWDSLASFLQMGHQLIANIKMMNCMRLEAMKVQEDHRTKVNHPLEEKAEVEHLLEKKMIEVEGLQETV